jgi:hypothetical protein
MIKEEITHRETCAICVDVSSAYVGMDLMRNLDHNPEPLVQGI